MKKILFCFLLISCCLLWACGDRDTACEKHTLTYHGEVAATCGAAGNIQYWHCTACDKYFSDVDATAEITDKNAVVIAATGAHSYAENDICQICGQGIPATGSFTYVLNADGASYTVLGNGAAATLVIPAYYMEKPVTAIGKNAFQQYRDLKSITIPHTVTAIGENAFKDCEALESITLPAGVTAVGKGAFAGCKGLVKAYGESVAAWCAIDFADSASTPMIYAKELYLEGTLVETLVIPAGVTEISDYAFYNCATLKSVEIPAGVTRIGAAAFQACSRLTSPALPMGLTEIEDYAFDFCRSITEIAVPPGVTRIGAYAFQRCDFITSLTLSESIAVIGEGAFAYCNGISSIVIPAGVTEIGVGAFMPCDRLEQVIFVAKEGWKCVDPTSDAVPAPISATDLVDTSTAATYIKQTYAACRWSREVNG